MIHVCTKDNCKPMYKCTTLSHKHTHPCSLYITTPTMNVVHKGHVHKLTQGLRGGHRHLRSWCRGAWGRWCVDERVGWLGRRRGTTDWCGGEICKCLLYLGVHNRLEILQITHGRLGMISQVRATRLEGGWWGNYMYMVRLMATSMSYSIDILYYVNVV